jgi:hypothetical protein
MASLRCPVWHFNYIVVDRTETKAATKKLEPAVSEEMGNGKWATVWATDKL